MAAWLCSQFNLIGVLIVLSAVQCGRYEPTWRSIDSRPLPDWYDDGKIGIFIHWGLFSVPSIAAPRMWQYWMGPPDKQRKDVVDFMAKNYRPDWTYADFGNQFTAEFYKPDSWADTFKKAGAKYIVLTTKHHDGFTIYPSKRAYNWNSRDVGPKRDLVGELASSIRNSTDIHFGLYHSLYEFFNPLYLEDVQNNHTTNDFVQDKTLPELYEIVNAYKPDVIWSDGDEGPDWYWNSTKFLAWLYNDSPVKDTVVVNDRWGYGTTCRHGGFRTCNDRYNPKKVMPYKWENCMTIDRKSFGYRREGSLKDYLTIQQLLYQVVSTVSCGGNILINVAPTHDGRILPIFEERLEQLGNWLRVNGNAIYSSRPWQHQNDAKDPNVWYTKQNRTTPSAEGIYAIVLAWPKDNKLQLDAPIPTPNTRVHMLGYPTELKWSTNTTSQGMIINMPVIPISLLPSQYAWTLQITHLKK